MENISTPIISPFFPKDTTHRSPPTLQIEVYIKHNYGAQVIYPHCEKATIFAEMLGQKTLTFDNLAHIKELGYKITQIHEDIDL